VVSSTPRPHFTPEKDPVPIVQEAGWATRPVWTGGKSRPHRDSISDRPARSQSLYQLSYPPLHTHTHTSIYLYIYIYIYIIFRKLFLFPSLGIIGLHWHNIIKLQDVMHIKRNMLPQIMVRV